MRQAFERRRERPREIQRTRAVRTGVRENRSEDIMSANIVVPEMGESIVDARIGAMAQAARATPSRVGEPLVELETDKVDVEVVGAARRRAGDDRAPAGDDVKIGEVLGTIADAAANGRKRHAHSNRARRRSGAVRRCAGVPCLRRGQGLPRLRRRRSRDGGAGSRRAGRAHGASVAARSPTATSRGAQCSLASADVEHQLGRRRRPASPRDRQTVARAGPDDLPAGRPVEERVRLSKRRATIARRLVEAQHTAAMLTTFNEVDMSAVMAVRERAEGLVQGDSTASASASRRSS